MVNEFHPVVEPTKRSKLWGWPDALRLKGSVLPHVTLPVTFIFFWALTMSIIHEKFGVKLELSNSVVTSISVVLGLLLAFRTNTSYDRFWEGRKLFATLITSIRCLSRIVWIGVSPSVSSASEKRHFLDLLLAYVVACKHHLRDEFGTHFPDLERLLPPAFHMTRNIGHAECSRRDCNADIEVYLDPEVCMNLPQEICMHLGLYQERLAHTPGGLEGALYGTMCAALAQATECLSSMERIHATPMPPAYRIHMRQSLMVYCLLLPFTFVETLGIYTAFIILVVSFVLLGIQEVGSEIEDPFGYDPNDIPLDDYCEELRLELRYLVARVPQRLTSALEEREDSSSCHTDDSITPAGTLTRAPTLPPKDPLGEILKPTPVGQKGSSGRDSGNSSSGKGGKVAFDPSIPEAGKTPTPSQSPETTKAPDTGKASAPTQAQDAAKAAKDAQTAKDEQAVASMQQNLHTTAEQSTRGIPSKSETSPAS